MKILFTILFLLFSVPSWAGTYYVTTGTNTFDGDTDCSGACTGGDIIIIDGGLRGDLRFRDLNGGGTYITIKNQDVNPDALVSITTDNTAGQGGLSFDTCKYVDVQGNNDADLTYGIKVTNDGTGNKPGTVHVYGESDHIKISYLEVTVDDPGSTNRIGIFVHDNALSTAWTFDTFEIHHNYIHDTTYSGMYLGENQPLADDDPYVANFLVHDNTLTNMGSYGITLKGYATGTTGGSIYNNTITTTGVVLGAWPDGTFHGIHISWNYGTSYSNVYNNIIIGSRDSGLLIGGANGTTTGSHNVYNNHILGCGTDGNTHYGHGITVYRSAIADIYDNVIVQPGDFGIHIYNGSLEPQSCNLDRNLIGDAPGGDIEDISTLATEGVGADANVYNADVADFGFYAWSDDADYTNDILAKVDVSGTITSSADESGVVAGGYTEILDITGDYWNSTIGADNSLTTALIQGLDSNLSEATGWNAVIRDVIDYTAVTLSDYNTITITFPAAATYDITASETITTTIAASTTAIGSALVADPTFIISVEIPPPIDSAGIISSSTGSEIVSGTDTSTNIEQSN